MVILFTPLVLALSSSAASVKNPLLLSSLKVIEGCEAVPEEKIPTFASIVPVISPLTSKLLPTTKSLVVDKFVNTPVV